MKKTYINPQMEVIKVATAQQVLAGSLDPENGSGTVGGPAPSGHDAEGRRYDFDDDWDD